MKRTWRYWPLTFLAGSLLFGSTMLLSQQPPAAASGLNDAEKEEFLRNAKILRTRGLSVGVTGTKQATLSNGKLTHDAHIQTIDERKAVFQSAAGTELNFRDSYKFNIAAYHLDRLVGLRMVPVSVERKIAGETASVTWWVDDLQMMELERYQNKIEPPNPPLWNDQMYQVRIFNNLIYNTDPNLGNLLITNDWKLRMIDFGRAFRTHKKLRNPNELVRIDRRLYNGLQELNEEALMAQLRRYLTKSQIKGVVARRDRILKFFDGEITKKGEAAIVCDMPGH